MQLPIFICFQRIQLKTLIHHCISLGTQFIKELEVELGGPDSGRRNISFFPIGQLVDQLVGCWFALGPEENPLYSLVSSAAEVWI